MMCGVPLISTDCPSGPQEILRGGQYGLLIPVGNADRLADAIEQTLNGNCPKTTAESWYPYTPDAIVNEYLELMFGCGSESYAPKPIGLG
jgi:glycosyltransferase involved in cell wall biosynthesis